MMRQSKRGAVASRWLWAAAAVGILVAVLLLLATLTMPSLWNVLLRGGNA